MADAISRGNFYSSTGVEIKDIKIDSLKIELLLSNEEGWGFKTFFIGKKGEILKIDEFLQPSYTFSRKDIYVRARIERSDGAYAWAQPIFVKI